MRTPRPRHRATSIAPTFVALAVLVAAACSVDDRRAGGGGDARGLAPDSFVSSAHATSSAGARLGDTALRRAAPPPAPARRDTTTTPGADVVIEGSPSGLVLGGDAVPPSGGATPGLVASGGNPKAPEPATIIVSEPGAAAPAPTPAPTPRSPGTPPKTPTGTLPGVMAAPVPHAPTRPASQTPPGTSDTASARPCGAAGTSDTASRSPCGRPGTSDTAAARHRAPPVTRGARERPVILLAPRTVKP